MKNDDRRRVNWGDREEDGCASIVVVPALGATLVLLLALLRRTR